MVCPGNPWVQQKKLSGSSGSEESWPQQVEKKNIVRNDREGAKKRAHRLGHFVKFEKNSRAKHKANEILKHLQPFSLLGDV